MPTGNYWTNATGAWGCNAAYNTDSFCTTETVSASDAYWASWNQVYTTGTTTAYAVRHAVAACDAAIASVQPEAQDRAEALLQQFLSPAQREQFARSSAFTVTAKSGRRYSLRRGWAGNVFLLDFHDRDVVRLCLHPETTIPRADLLIAQKMLLEADEDAFLRTANKVHLHPSAASLLGSAA